MLVVGHEDTGKSMKNLPYMSAPPPAPWKFQAEVLVTVLSYLNSIHVFYVMYADFLSGGFSIRPS